MMILICSFLQKIYRVGRIHPHAPFYQPTVPKSRFLAYFGYVIHVYEEKTPSGIPTNEISFNLDISTCVVFKTYFQLFASCLINTFCYVCSLQGIKEDDQSAVF